MENQPQMIRLEANRIGAIGRTIFFAPFFALFTLLVPSALGMSETPYSIGPALAAMLGWTSMGLLTVISFLQAVRPARLEITPQGLTVTKFKKTLSFIWAELDSPALIASQRGAHLVRLNILASGKRFLLSPSEFRCQDDELLDILTAAKSGQLIGPAQWRKIHPTNPWKPVLLGVGTFIIVVIVRLAPMYLRHH